MTVSPFFKVTPPARSPGVEIAISGELVRGSETQVIDTLLPRVKRDSVALNLSAVERIDAAGIAALITLYCTAAEAGQEFSVVSPSQHVLELLQLVGLTGILVEKTDSREEELEAESLTAA